MSSTLTTERDWVRELLNDNIRSRYAYDSARLNRLLIALSVSLGATFDLGEEWVEDAITVAADDPDYDLPTGVEYHRILGFKLESEGYFLTSMAPNVFEHKYRRGEPADYVTGTPRAYYQLETAATVASIRLGPIPNEADSIHILRSALPASTLTDATVIPLGDLGLMSLRYTAAAQLLRGMTPEQRAERNVNIEIVQDWDRWGEKNRQREMERQRSPKIHKVLAPGTFH